MKARKAAAGAISHRPRPAVAVDPGERRRLIECCAFFRAERFRAVEPGRVRDQDLREAAADNGAVLERRRKARKQ